MNRTAVIAGSVVAALATGGVLAVNGGAQAPTGQTIKLVTKNCKFKFNDVPPRQREPRTGRGDSYALSCQAFDEAGARAGKFDLISTFTKGGRAARGIATGVYDLVGGNIYFSALIVGRGTTTTGVITGGDGAYVGARGTFGSIDLPGGQIGYPANDTITLLP